MQKMQEQFFCAASPKAPTVAVQLDAIVGVTENPH